MRRRTAAHLAAAWGWNNDFVERKILYPKHFSWFEGFHTCMSATIRGSKSNGGKISKVHFRIGYFDVNFCESFFFNPDSEVWLFIWSMVIISYKCIIFFNIQKLLNHPCLFLFDKVEVDREIDDWLPMVKQCAQSRNT